MSRSSRRAKARRARKLEEARQELRQLDHELRRRQRDQVRNPLWYLADEGYNRHVVYWEMGELRADFEAEDEEDGWISLTRGDGRCMWYHPGTRRAYWTGFDPRVEFFVRDIEQYIHAKFYTP